MGTRRATRHIAAIAMMTAAAVVAACAPEAPLVELDEPVPGAVVARAPDTVGPLRLVGDRMLDAHGRTVLLRGMNSVAKSAPFVSTDEPGSLGGAELEYLRNSGFNVVRLGVAFSALAPEPGVVDEQYLDRVLVTLERLTDAGLWVQLDFHQDVFHLLPGWASPPDAAALSDEAPALLSFIGWAAAYLSDRSLRQWNSFVAGEPIIDGRSVASVLGDAAAALAARVSSNERVIGIELLNEPFPGDPVLDCIAQGCPGRDRQLSDRYAEMAAPIRAVAPDLPLWIEPFAPTGYVAQPSLPRPAIDGEGAPAQIGVAWHLYCKDTDGGRPEPVDDATRVFCETRLRNGFDAGDTLSRQVGGPAVLNEFGASRNPLDAAIVTRLADERHVSWMYWHLAPATSPTDSTIEDVVEAQIIRPYPQATAGTPGTLRYAPATGEFSYSFTPDASIDAPTSIAVPARAYPAGYTVEVDNGTVTSEERAGLVTVVPDDGGPREPRRHRRTSATSGLSAPPSDRGSPTAGRWRAKRSSDLADLTHSTSC